MDLCHFDKYFIDPSTEVCLSVRELQMTILLRVSLKSILLHSGELRDCLFFAFFKGCENFMLETVKGLY